MTNARFILTINGGGTKTTAAFWSQGGHLLSRAHGGACNVFRDTAAGVAVIDGLWRELCGVVGLDTKSGRCDVAISLTLAGAGLSDARQKCFEALKDFQNCHISTDSYGALMGAFGGGPGAVMIVGTGVSACRLAHDGSYESFAGWGFPAGDRGSGAWLGLQLVSDYLQFLDGTAALSQSMLWEHVARTIGKDRSLILPWLAHAGPRDFAQWAPEILKAASEGDPEGVDLVAAAVDELKRLKQKVCGDPELPFLITGSLGRALRPWLGFEEATARPSPHRGAFLIGNGDLRAEFAP